MVGQWGYLSDTPKGYAQPSVTAVNGSSAAEGRVAFAVAT